MSVKTAKAVKPARPNYRRELAPSATVGLLIGGVLAAPFGALIAKKAKPKLLLVFVGSVLTLTGAYGVWGAFS